jgi:hypothetical protein
VVGLIIALPALVAFALREVRPDFVRLLVSAVLVAAGTVVVRLCRHPQLTAPWLRHRWHLGDRTAKRLASVVLSALVGLVAAVGPVAAILALFLFSLLGMADDTSRIWAGLIFMGVGGGALVNILARRLRARSAGGDRRRDRPRRKTTAVPTELRR